MKQLIAALFLVFALTALAHGVAREYVVVEVSTGTWCQYCPGASMGCHDLLQNGYPVAVIKNHNGDSFANTYSNARNSYYSPSGYPTAYFDGSTSYVGGSYSSSLYNTYVPYINARMAVPSHFSIAASGSMNGSTINIAAVVSKPEADSNTNVVLHCVFTETNISFAWQNQSMIYDVNRLMAPNQSGTAISLGTGGQTTVNLSAAWNSAWNFDNGEVILFLQNTSTKEILQAKKYSLPDLLISTPPNPSVLVAPALGTVTTILNPTLQWANGGYSPTGYRLYMGTDGGGTANPTNLVNGTDLGLVTSYQHPSELSYYNTYYWKIVPYNAYGNTANCPIWYFNTQAPMTSDYAVGTGGDFTTLTHAINHLNANGVGPGGVFFDIAPGTYGENPPAITVSGTDTSPVVFRRAPGALTKPLITPAGGTDTFGFKLQGASWIVIDGIDIANPAGQTGLCNGIWLAGVDGRGSSNNTIRNCSVSLSATNASSRGIYSVGAMSGANSYNTIQGNQINDSFNGIYCTGNATAGQESHENLIRGNTLTNVRSYGIYHAYGIDTAIFGNTISFMSGSNQRLYGINSIGTNSSAQIYDNTISGGSTTNTVYLINLNSGSYDVHNNVISSISSTGTSGVYGAFLANGQAYFHDNVVTSLTGLGNVYGVNSQNCSFHLIYNNQINDLANNGTGAYAVQGIRVLSGTEIRVYNNAICNLRAPASSAAAPQVSGIAILGGTASKIYYNSVFLDASGTTQAFSTAGLYFTPTGDSHIIKNNAFVNNSVPGTSGKTVAFWKSTAGFSNLEDTNGNIYYAGTPGLSNLVCQIGNDPFQTLEAYQAAVGIDQNSFSENVPFISIVYPYDLHVRTDVPTAVEGNGQITECVAIDIDNEPRVYTTPDIGCDEGDFTPLGGELVHVVLAYPPDASMYHDPHDMYLQWMEPASSNLPESYEVYLSQDIDDLFNSIYLETNNTDYDLSAQTGVELGFNSLWYWAVLPVYAGGQMPEIDHPAFMVWSFSTMAGPVQSATITSSDTSVNISWQPSPGASGYRVYAADNPQADQWDLVESTTENSIIIPVGEARSRFFRVHSVSGETP